MNMNHIIRQNILWVSINILLVSFALPSVVNAQSEINLKDAKPAERISEESFIDINGIEQWVTIRGASSKPIILFLHGGPGSPLSPYSDKLYKDFEKDFIIVQWDQRGTGRTFGKNAPQELTPEYLKGNPLSLERMTNDGIALSEYLLKHLNKQKIILFGTSWGSALGVIMASKRPELYYAYVGHSQIVNPAIDSNLYNRIYKIVKKKNDKVALTILDANGKPPYDRAKKVGQLFRILKKYEDGNSTPAPKNWFVPSSEYENELDNQNRMDGDDYSFVNFVGDNKLGVQSMSGDIDLINTNLDFQIPIYIIQGNEDILTPKEESKKYFDKIKAPKKKYYLLPKTAHGFNLSVLDTQYKIFKSILVL